MSFYVSPATFFFLLHCDEWDRVITLASNQEFRVLLLELLYMDTFCGFRANNFMMLCLIRERPFNLKRGLCFGFFYLNILIPNVAEKNILILVEEKKNNLIQSFCHII